MARQPRQRPVSCIFCRTRKLRCNRQFPCSNCTSRGVICELGNGVVPSGVARAEGSLGGLGGDALLKLLSRIDKLEKTVSDQSEELKRTRNAVFGNRGSSWTSSVTTETSPALLGPPSTQVHDPPVSVHLQRFTDDALWLESGCLPEPLVVKFVSDDIEFRTSPIRQITKQGFFVFSGQHSADGLYPPIKCIFLPLRKEAAYLTQKYFLEINYFHHIIHYPTVEAKVAHLYDDLENQKPVDKGAALLLICLLANVCLSWTTYEDAHCTFFDAATANRQIMIWTKAGMDLVDHCQRLTTISIESVQGATILFFVTFLMEGISGRVGEMLTRAIHMARNLGLHMIDSPRFHCWPSTSVKAMSPSQKEVGRRLIWYLSATDWYDLAASLPVVRRGVLLPVPKLISHSRTLGSLSMPLEGSYMMDPRGLQVRKPLNVDDEDLVDDQEIVARPYNEETSASYFLQRIRLSELFRELNLLETPNDEDPEKGQYNRILEIDAQLHRFLSELPPFFSLEFAGEASQNFTRESSRNIAGAILRRCTIHLLVHRYLCKIHLPFLARAAVDPAFAYSRRVCLESARIIIRSEAQLSKETLTVMSLRTRMTMVLRRVYLASIALVVDACVAEGLQHEGKPTAEEILEAWNTLEQAKKVSTTAQRLLELSRMVLRKQNPSHPALAAMVNDVEQQQQQQPGRGEIPVASESVVKTRGHPLDSKPETGQSEDLMVSDEQWLGFEPSMDVDNIDWEQFFWGVDSAPFL